MCLNKVLYHSESVNLSANIRLSLRIKLFDGGMFVEGKFDTLKNVLAGILHSFNTTILGSKIDGFHISK